MAGIFEQIYLPKDKRNSGLNTSSTGLANQEELNRELHQYREKVKSYSSYLIGRKIQKNTPKYTDN